MIKASPEKGAARSTLNQRTRADNTVSTVKLDIVLRVL